MDYGDMIRGAWAATWRYRYLWLLGLFAGGAVGAGGGGGGGGSSQRTQRQWDPRDVEGLPRGMAEAGEAAAGWTGAQWLPLVIGAVLIAVGLAALSFIAQGGMATASAAIAAGRSSSFGRAWRAGLHLGWRYVGLWLALLAGALVVAAAVAAVTALLMGAGIVSAGATSGSSPNGAVIAVLIVALITGVVIGAAAIVAASIVATFAQRAIAIEDEGPFAALGDGWRLFRRHLGASVLTWLVNVALSIGAGIAAAFAVGAVVVVLGLIGVGLWAALGTSALTIAYAALAGIALVAVALTVSAIINTFFWHYWTRAYLQLRASTGIA